MKCDTGFQDLEKEELTYQGNSEKVSGEQIFTGHISQCLWLKEQALHYQEDILRIKEPCHEFYLLEMVVNKDDDDDDDSVNSDEYHNWVMCH